MARRWNQRATMVSAFSPLDVMRACLSRPGLVLFSPHRKHLNEGGREEEVVLFDAVLVSGLQFLTQPRDQLG